MALIFKDRIKETTVSTGNGSITLAGSVDGFRSFEDIGNSNTTYYVIYDTASYDFEVGLGTYSVSGLTRTLSRDTVYQTSAGNTTKIVFGAGSKEVFVTSPASRHVFLDDSGNLTVDGTTYLNAISNRWTKTSSANQTAYTGTDDNGATLSVNAQSQVFINGILLEASDYSIAGTTQVNLTTGASASDIVEIFTYAPFTLGSVLQPSNNLSDVSSASTSLTNLGGMSASGGTFGGAIDMGSNNITTTGKVLFANMYATTSDLPSATTYHGMFAHVHATGKGYFAHGGNWIELANESALSSYAPLAGATFTGDISGTNATLSGYLRGPSSFTIDPATHGDNNGTVVIAGNLQVDGTTTTINSTTVAIDDLNFSIATDAGSSSSANGAGITIGGAGATFTYAHADTSWNMNKPLNVTGTVTATGAITANAGVVVDNITIDGTEIDLSSGDLTIDVEGEIIIDANQQGSGNGILLKDDGTLYGSIFRSSSHLHIKAEDADKDLKFMGNDSDGGGEITALTLDMSQAGEADFNSAIKVGGGIVAHQTNKGVLEYSANQFMMRAYGASSGDGFITFKTGGGGGSTDTERMRIKSNGVVQLNNGIEEQFINVTSTNTSDANYITSSAIQIDASTANNFAVNVGSNSPTLSFTNLTSGKGNSITLEVTYGGGTITWPSAVDWNSATAPTQSSSGVDLYVFYSRDGGTTILGFTAGQALA